ncbi:hypothetical protein M427DRAFT_36391 [Gonapodya prolifera JEL478]|uniref:Uncharacterized protein n=1 Tax=Gonapodya prolifera (strain JEL478) TaxID=1344416 RepID=A0A139A2A9_GONPJ|nr:hypothetical protein M427DRAFT_36391 [Gonapodya prolifera JEL478]|eukprot:KXS10917.1 hypothetical protein M427DRAFT_36391 [Gonapodya prolifera JEL478]
MRTPRGRTTNQTVSRPITLDPETRSSPPQIRSKPASIHKEESLDLLDSSASLPDATVSVLNPSGSDPSLPEMKSSPPAPRRLGKGTDDKSEMLPGNSTDTLISQAPFCPAVTPAERMKPQNIQTTGRRSPAVPWDVQLPATVQPKIETNEAVPPSLTVEDTTTRYIRNDSTNVALEDLPPLPTTTSAAIHQSNLHDFCVTTGADFNSYPSSATLANFPSSLDATMGCSTVSLPSFHAYQAMPSSVTFPGSLQSEDFLPMYMQQSPSSPTDDGNTDTHMQFSPGSPINMQSPASQQYVTAPSDQASAFQFLPYVPTQVAFPGFPLTPHFVPSGMVGMDASGQPVSMTGMVQAMQPAGQYVFLPNTATQQYAHVQNPVGMGMGMAGGNSLGVAIQGVQTVGMIGQYAEYEQTPQARHAGGPVVPERDSVDKRRMTQQLYRQKRKAAGGTMCPVTGRVYADIWGLRRHWEKSKCACRDMPRP